VQEVLPWNGGTRPDDPSAEQQVGEDKLLFEVEEEEGISEDGTEEVDVEEEEEGNTEVADLVDTEEGYDEDHTEEVGEGEDEEDEATEVADVVAVEEQGGGEEAKEPTPIRTSRPTRPPRTKRPTNAPTLSPKPTRQPMTRNPKKQQNTNTENTHTSGGGYTTTITVDGEDVEINHTPAPSDDETSYVTSAPTEPQTTSWPSSLYPDLSETTDGPTTTSTTTDNSGADDLPPEPAQNLYRSNRPPRENNVNNLPAEEEASVWETQEPTEEPSDATDVPTNITAGFPEEETDAPNNITAVYPAEETESPVVFNETGVELTDNPTTLSPTTTSPVLATDPPTPLATTNSPTSSPGMTTTDAPSLSATGQPAPTEVPTPDTEAPAPTAIPSSLATTTIPAVTETTTTAVPTWSDAAFPENDIMSLIESEPQLSNFASAVSRVGFSSNLAGAASTDGDSVQYTAFATTNAALLESIDSEYFAMMLAEDAYSLHLQSFVLNHVSSDQAYQFQDLTDGLEFATLDGEPVQVIVNATGTYLLTFAALWGMASEVQVRGTTEVADTASNGVLYQVDTAVVPIWYYVSLYDILAFIPEQFGTLTDLIVAAGLESTIEGLEGATFIAPNNDAFEALPEGVLDYLNSPEGADSLEQVLLYHIVPKIVNYVSLQDGLTTEVTMQGEEILIDSGDGVFSFNGQQPFNLYMDRFNIQYEIQSVLIPSSLDVDIPTDAPVAETPRLDASAFGYVDVDGNYTTLANGLGAIGASSALDDPSLGPFTLFLPDDGVFEEAVGAEYLSKLFTPDFDLHLRSLILYQVSDFELNEAEMTDQLLVTMSNLLTARVTFGIADDGFNSSILQLTTSSVSFGRTPIINITETDVLVQNAALHKVDNPLLPFWFFFDAESAITAMGRFSTLVELFETTGLMDSVLSGLENATILAPNNYVFDLLPESASDYLMDPANVDALRDVLLYHIIPQVVPFTTLEFGDYTYPTMLGADSTVTFTVSESTNTTGVKVMHVNNGIAPISSNFFLSKDNVMYETGLVLIPDSLASAVEGADGGDTEHGSWPTAFEAFDMNTDGLFLEDPYRRRD